jgi:hypothetical protein
VLLSLPGRFTFGYLADTCSQPLARDFAHVDGLQHAVTPKRFM